MPCCERNESDSQVGNYNATPNETEIAMQYLLGQAI